MHETAVAESILQTILQHAESLMARPVRAVVSCGQFNALNDEAVQFAFEAVAAGTVAEGMTLQIKHIPLRATCKACRMTYDFNIYDPVCTACQSMQFDFEPDAPLLLENIEFEDKP